MAFRGVKCKTSARSRRREIAIAGVLSAFTPAKAERAKRLFRVSETNTFALTFHGIGSTANQQSSRSDRVQARHRCSFGPVNSWICVALTHGLHGRTNLQDAPSQRRSAMDGCSIQKPAANKDHAGVLVEMFSGSRAGPPDQDRLRKQSFTAGNRCPNSASACAAQSSDRQSLSAAAGTIGRGELHEI